MVKRLLKLQQSIRTGTKALSGVELDRVVGARQGRVSV